MDVKVEVKQRTLRTIEQKIMVQARVLEANIHFTLMYTADNIYW